MVQVPEGSSSKQLLNVRAALYANIKQIAHNPLALSNAVQFSRPADELSSKSKNGGRDDFIAENRFSRPVSESSSEQRSLR
jgi:hypothetical protein